MATSRSQTPAPLYGSMPPPPQDASHLSRGYGDRSHFDVDANDFASPANRPPETSPLSQSLQPQAQRLGRFEENFDANTRGSSILDGEMPQRSASRASNLNQGAAPARTGTLKKRSSVRRTGSLKRSGSRRSLHAGSIRGVSTEDEDKVIRREDSVFYTPVPTSGSPTETLANRFQAWRKLLKDLIVYFREVASSYEHRAKSLLKVSNVVNNTNAPSVFLTEGGLNDATRILRDFHKLSVAEANKARDIENEVINQLGGLRADLAQKIKEIKSLSGDFKNSVEKEKETTRKCVAALEESLAAIDSDPHAIAGKGDPYVVRLAVDRQVERQIDEENYLHRAYLNIENSGRELESIVVGEIQKAYNALAGILKRDADEMYSTVEKLRNGPIGLPRDLEWNHFIKGDPHFVDAGVPLRRLEDIVYPGKHHPATAEVRAGMLERKSKYLKSYTPGWYVLSPTHLHEFKSADRIYTQPPVMSLYLPDQKLGSHSQPGSSSHKFVLKGRQTGSMHRGHTWVFRAETYDTMLAWYDDIKNLTEKSGEERDAFVRRHARSVSQGSARSVSSDGGLEEDEADEVPYSANQSMTEAARDEPPQRPSPGGRFPSDIQVNRNLQAPPPGSSGSSEVGNDITTASGGLQGSYPQPYDPEKEPDQTDYHNASAYNQYTYNNNEDTPYQYPPPVQPQSTYYPNPAAPYEPAPYQASSVQVSVPYQAPPVQPTAPYQAPPVQPTAQHASHPAIERHESTYGDWMAPVAAGAAAGAIANDAYHRNQQHEPLAQPLKDSETQTKPVGTENPSLAPVASEPESLTTITTIASTLPSSAVEERRSFLKDTEIAESGIESTKGVNGGPIFPPETGEINPRVLRQNTDMSISDLHVPGEFPKRLA